MAAGLGFKDFVTGEVLTAADVDGYLMQGVWVFASAAARDAAVTSPQEGNFAYLKDTNVTTYYTGSAWANLDTTGMTNPMTTTGDTIYSSSGSTPARLGIGTTGQVLTVAAGVPSWATPASGAGLDLIKTASFSAVSSFSFDADTFTSTYDNYKLIMTWTQSTGNDELGFRMRLAGTDATGTDYISQFIQGNNTTVTAERNTETSGRLSYSGSGYKNGLAAEILGPKLAASTLYRSINAAPTSSVWFLRDFNGIHTPATAYDSMSIIPRTGTITGTYSSYGYKK